MRAIASWPSALRDHLQRTYGDPVGVNDLGGMSLGQVWRVRFSSGSAIVKVSPSNKEILVYRRVAPTLGEIGVSTPHVEWSGCSSDACWMVMEDIPEPLSRASGDRWRADTRVLETLCRLHGASLDTGNDLPELFQPRWTTEMSESALSLFPSEVAAGLAPLLASLRCQCQQLLEPQCLISGDPNPANWGVRSDGTVALFDWERFGRGTPALDLAIIVPGLGNRAQYEGVASDYIEMWHHMAGSEPWSMRELARDIVIAKAWTVIEFMANHTREGTEATGEVVDWLVSAVPLWLDGVAAGT